MFYKFAYTPAWVALACIGGCSANPPANVVAQMTRTETSIQQAEQQGAQQGALKELQDAKSKLADAREAYENKDFELALRLAEEAHVDAQYAAAKAQTVREEQAAADAQRSIETLRREATRSGG